MGLFLGSFYNVVGIRVPKKETLLGRSHCSSCEHTLSWWELIPIVGYIILRGKCKECHSHVAIKYPLMELLTALLFLGSYVILQDNMVEYIVVVIFISLLIIVTVSDLYYKIVPDSVLLITGLPILILRFFSNTLAWYEFLGGGILAFLFLYLIALYGKKRFKQDALGGGDIKLYFIIGLVLGYQLVFLSLVFAGLFGMIYGLFRPKDQDGYIAFVPFIFAGSIVTYFLGDAIIIAYNDFIINLLM
jgi:leader peptidase (prepilin peptidase)/N-methyltransferase